MAGSAFLGTVAGEAPRLNVICLNAPPGGVGLFNRAPDSAEALVYRLTVLGDQGQGTSASALATLGLP